MSKHLCMVNWTFLLLLNFTVSALMPAPVFAQYACVDSIGSEAGAKPYDNPCPLIDDVVIPMPAGLAMVFRVVEVPGGEFWGNPSRNVEMGDPKARMFEGPRMVSVAGSFPDKSGNSWSMLIGKYEVSVAQYAGVLGAGDIGEGIRTLAKDGPLKQVYGRVFAEDVTELEVRKILAAPVRGLRADDLERFTRLYTDWCYQDEQCVSALPKFGSMPGFFRLPTEIEWEFAARRRTDGDTRVSFLPFNESETNQYAYVSTANRVRERPTSIGRFKSTSFGIHDLYGNVGELVDGRFYAELGQGKPGMYVSRGESYAHSLTYSDLRPSARSEVQAYRRDDEGKIVSLSNVRLGMRLAIGSQTVPDLETLEVLQLEYTSYRSTDRLLSASGKSTQAAVLNTVEPLEEIDLLLDVHSQKNTFPIELAEQLKQLTQSARINLVRTSETLASELVERATFNAAEAGRALFRERKARGSLQIMQENNRQGAKRIVADLERKAESYAEDFINGVRLYQDTTARLASYRDFAMTSIDENINDDHPEAFKIALTLLREHTEHILQGRPLSSSDILLQFKDKFAQDSTFEIVDK